MKKIIEERLLAFVTSTSGKDFLTDTISFVLLVFSSPISKHFYVFNRYYFLPDNEIRLGIFLPPLQHLLLEFRPLNQKTVVSVATDDWRLLQLVESYLLQFERVSG